ncbi:MAG: hypothetical protein A2312_00165 [Candidatus Staskawiczbacteria bacterium RIFOXYB2_FULL_32_9]|uniref:Uncharacterized protein n=1 Tax=Candidatus Staskawiczbacteria bacterium RIFOXYD1_FULL_32_13 TaxID=1802234 RepID=A0A1G2JLM9_9BACT|nr:MAG: hypothetical protein UR22_C0006G0048 [Parcubacteria group bacterium GW2011_GWC2_32_10]OGJ50287.1 MAG: hypothetical protein A2229_03610 [Candidatus Peregrinibacteria bacterium RIFOXYA2_FULL_33_7]OGZ78448.1 MAG: hypothetical protein A2360_04060 [Candidatus Staskawiczbacteria bacterium RIFOXYB1_FULL_32_11]OGZ84841.1 MAG: hypothetical protein A2312_00165 [Candidatus Staskawiczbacteria bacterium RIFOXYB2_FULL_32_9]OGZ87316.1 MAG: hypothetical protein A2463_03655 [Candidatus Staskawiczbacteri
MVVIISRRVTQIDRNQTFKLAIARTHEKKWGEGYVIRRWAQEGVVAKAPSFSGTDIDIDYVKLEIGTQCNRTVLAYLASLGYKPLSDPQAVLADLESDPKFACEHDCADFWHDDVGVLDLHCWISAHTSKAGLKEGYVAVFRGETTWWSDHWFAVRRL